MTDMIKKCNICPRECNIDRSKGEKGYCGADKKIRVARASLHMWEEPCISGNEGSGAVFFSGCSLKCVYCQNRDIAIGNYGLELNIEELAEVFLVLENNGANNINLVTPTHYVPQIVQAIKKARCEGMKLPIVYNTSGYESVGTLKSLSGLVDIYLTDFKYKSNVISSRYSNVNNYFQVADEALTEMHRQIPHASFKNGIMKKGIIVRHMILPGNTKDSKEIILHLYQKYGDDIFISIMSQYTPTLAVQQYPEINRKLTKREYEKVVDYALELGVENAFIQYGDVAKESFIPDFYESDVLKKVKGEV